MFFLLSLLSFAADNPNISGVYTVISQPNYDGVNCKKQDASTYQWILTDSGGSLSINVQGTTGFPNLRGSLSHANGDEMVIRVVGYNKAKDALSWFDLSINMDSNKISGTRTFINESLTHCVWTVSGHKH